MKFTQPVSMQCSQEQFDADLKKPLKDLGYKISTTNHGYDQDEILLVTKFMGESDFISSSTLPSKNDHNRHFIDHYNPQLFLALASMTDEHNGIAGEWYVGDNEEFEVRKNIGIIKDYWKKATKKELITHFTKKAKEYSSPLIDDKKYAEISLRIDGVLTRFIAESEYKSTIDWYENEVTELSNIIEYQKKILKNLAEKLDKIKELM
jgi:hypothetical protein